MIDCCCLFFSVVVLSNRSIRLSLAVSKYSVKILAEIINIQFACQAFRSVCERGEIRNGIFLNVNETLPFLLCLTLAFDTPKLKSQEGF